MELFFPLHKSIITFLTSIPNIHDSDSQRSLIYQAGLDSELLNQIPVGKPPSEFVPLLVSVLIDYGTLNDGRNALEAILETAKNYVGQDKQSYCDTLINNLHTNLRRSPQRASHETALFNRLLKQYTQSLKERYCTIKILGMSQPIPLHKIFVNVNILKKISIQQRASIEELEKEFNKKQFGFGNKIATWPGSELLNKIDYNSIPKVLKDLNIDIPKQLFDENIENRIDEFVTPEESLLSKRVFQKLCSIQDDVEKSRIKKDKCKNFRSKWPCLPVVPRPQGKPFPFRCSICFSPSQKIDKVRPRWQAVEPTVSASI